MSDLQQPPEQSVRDEQLVLRLIERDESALRELIQRLAVPTEASLWRRFRDIVDRSEVAAAVNMAAFNLWRYATRFDPKQGTVDAWFYRIAENELIDRIRSNSSHMAAFDVEPTMRSRQCSDPSSHHEDRQLVSDLSEIIDGLAPLQQAIITADLAAGEHADDERLAQRHDTSVNSIRVSRTKARDRIRNELFRRGHFKDLESGGGS